MTTSPTFSTPVMKPAWLPDALFEEWKRLYIDAGGTASPYSATVATEQIRQSPMYDTFFPGLRREDGSLRMTESQYYNRIDSYMNIIEGVDVNPDLFAKQFEMLIEGDVSPDEFASRVNNLYERVALAGDAIRDWYTTEFGIDMTNSALIGSLMDPDLGASILNRQITMAEIGGEASERNFSLSSQFVTMLAEQGMERGEADRLFGSAEKMLPMLNAIAARNANPDDDFDIQEFVSAAGFGGDSAENARTIDILLAQEDASFTGGAQIEYKKSQTGGVAGLAQT